jgi:hypothetical protein
MALARPRPKIPDLRVADEVVVAGIGKFPTATKKIGALLT